MEYNLPYPQIWHRSKVERYELHRGRVVAFMKYEFEEQRTGIIIMDDKQMLQGDGSFVTYQVRTRPVKIRSARII